MHSSCSFPPIFTQKKGGFLFKFFKRTDAYRSGVDKIWPASLAKPQEQNEKSAHFVSWEQTHKMNVMHFNNNWHLCNSEKNFLSKETTDFIIQIRSSNHLPRQSSVHQNATHKEGRKELWFNLQNTKIISGWLPACLALCEESVWQDAPCGQLCSDSAGEAVPTCPGRKEWAAHLSSSSSPLAAQAPWNPPGPVFRRYL